MEALLWLSGLLAAGAVSAVGLGYARAAGTTAGQPGSGVSATGQPTTRIATGTGTDTQIRTSTGTTVSATGVLKFTMAGGRLVTTYSEGSTTAAARFQVATDLVNARKSYLSENGIQAVVGNASDADFAFLAAGFTFEDAQTDIETGLTVSEAQANLDASYGSGEAEASGAHP